MQAIRFFATTKLLPTSGAGMTKHAFAGSQAIRVNILMDRRPTKIRCAFAVMRSAQVTIVTVLLSSTLVGTTRFPQKWKQDIGLFLSLPERVVLPLELADTSFQVPKHVLRQH